MSRFRASVPITEDWQHFDFRVEDRVATVTLNRPEKLNPLTFESYADLRDLLRELPHRGDAEVLVIRGEGKAFCAGGDVHEIIGELIRMEPRDLVRFTRMTGEVIQAMRECPLPIIAGIQGIAAGAGSVIALASDFRVVAESARFAFLFTRVGLSGGDMGAAWLLPRIVGVGHATKLLMLGDTIDAATADRYGLVSQLVSDDQLEDAVTTLARRLADGPTMAYAHTKALITRELDASFQAGLEMDAMTQALLMTTADHKEFHAAFTEETAARLDRPVKTCLVTGAGRGIGRAVAERLSADGHRVALVARSKDELEQVAAGLTSALVLPADLTVAGEVDRVFGEVERQWGPVEVLVPNAGVGHAAPLVETTDEDWARVLELNLTVPFRCVRRALPAMVGAGWGRIVVVASVVAKRGESQVSAYTASKHGVLGLVRSAAAEVARSGVTVNAVCPGYVDTPMTDETLATISARSGRSPAESLAALERRQPIGRLVTPAEVADVVALCIGNGAINGQGINVDGGAVQS